MHLPDKKLEYCILDKNRNYDRNIYLRTVFSKKFSIQMLALMPEPDRSNMRSHLGIPMGGLKGI